jgi:Bacterial Ig domain/CARDB
MKVTTLLKPAVLGLTALGGFVAMPNAYAAPITWNGWTFDYTVGVNDEGLALKNVKYQTHTLLKKISLPLITSGNANVAGVPCDVPTDDQIDAVVTPMPWANNATVSQRQFMYLGRQWYEIGVYKTIEDREYFQAYYLSNDGLFDAHLYSRGFSCPDRQMRIPHWRVDVDMDGAASDVIESTFNTQTSINSYPNFKVAGTEFSEAYYEYLSPQPVKRVRDTITNNSAAIAVTGLNFSHPDGNVTQPPRVTQQLYDFNTVWEGSSVLYKAAEDTGANALNMALMNSENINGQDLLYWYKGIVTPIQDYNWGISPIDPNMWFTASLKIVPNWQALPDVVVDDISYDSYGQYKVTVTNLGATVPADKSVGVGISVDGVYKTYVSTRTLLQGETRTLTTTELNRSFIPAGDHTVTAWADDLNRFAETNETNNKLDKTITTYGPTVKIKAPAKNATVSGSSVVLSATASDPSGIQQGSWFGLEFYLDGQLIGRKPTSPFTITWNSNTVSEGLHGLTVIAYNKLGQPSGESTVIKVVRDLTSFSPDLIVTALSYANGKFSCTLKNAGTGSVPTGTWISLAYFVDGVYRTWTTTPGPIVPGASVNLGTLGSSFNISSGSHDIKVIVDDQGAIAESNDFNNTLSKTITVP